MNIKLFLILLLVTTNIYSINNSQANYRQWVKKLEQKKITSIASFDNVPENISYFNNELYFTVKQNRINSDIYKINVNGGFAESFLNDVFSEKSINFYSNNKYVFSSNEEDSRGDIYLNNRGKIIKISMLLGPEYHPILSKNGKSIIYIEGIKRKLVLVDIKNTKNLSYSFITSNVEIAKFKNSSIIVYIKRDDTNLYSYNIKTKKIKIYKYNILNTRNINIINDTLIYSDKILKDIVLVDIKNGNKSYIKFPKIEILGNIVYDNDNHLYTTGKYINSDKFHLFKIDRSASINRGKNKNPEIEYKFTKQYIRENKVSLKQQRSFFLSMIIYYGYDKKIVKKATRDYLKVGILGNQNLDSLINILKENSPTNKRDIDLEFIYLQMLNGKNMKEKIELYISNYGKDKSIETLLNISKNRLIDIDKIDKDNLTDILRILISKYNFIQDYEGINENNSLIIKVLNSLENEDDIDDFITSINASQLTLKNLLKKITSPISRDIILKNLIEYQSNTKFEDKKDYLLYLKKINDDIIFQDALKYILLEKIKNINDFNTILQSIKNNRINLENSKILASIIEYFTDKKIDLNSLKNLVKINFHNQIFTITILNYLDKNKKESNSLISDTNYINYYNAYRCLVKYKKEKRSKSLMCAKKSITKFYNSNRTNIEGLFLLAEINKERVENNLFNEEYLNVLKIYDYLETIGDVSFRSRINYKKAIIYQAQKKIIKSIKYYEKALDENLIFASEKLKSDFYFNLVDMYLQIDNYKKAQQCINVLQNTNFVKNSNDYSYKLNFSIIRLYQLEGETELVDSYINKILHRQNISKYHKAKILLNKSLFNVINEDAKDYESAYESAILSEKEFKKVHVNENFNKWIKVGIGFPILPVYKINHFGKARYNFDRGDEDILIKSIKINYLNSANLKYKTEKILYKKLKLAKNKKDLLSQINSLNELGYFYLEQGFDEKAKLKFLTALKISKSTGGKLLQKALESVYKGLLRLDLNSNDLSIILKSIETAKKDKSIKINKLNKIKMYEGLFLLSTKKRISKYMASMIWRNILTEIEPQNYKLKATILYLLTIYSPNGNENYRIKMEKFFKQIEHSYWVDYTNNIICKNILISIEKLYNNFKKNIYNMINNYYIETYNEKYNEFAESIINKNRKKKKEITKSLKWLDNDLKSYLLNNKNDLENNTIIYPISTDTIKNLINKYSYLGFDDDCQDSQKIVVPNIINIKKLDNSKIYANSVIDLERMGKNRVISSNNIILFKKTTKKEKLENAQEILINIDNLNINSVLFSKSDSTYLIDILNMISNTEKVKLINAPIELILQSPILKILANRDVEQLEVIDGGNSYILGAKTKSFMEKFPSAKKEMILNIKLAQKYERYKSKEYNKLVSKKYLKAKNIMDKLGLNDKYGYELRVRLAKSYYKNQNYKYAVNELKFFFDSLYTDKNINPKKIIRAGDILYKSLTNLDSLDDAIKVLKKLIIISNQSKLYSWSAKYNSKMGFLFQKNGNNIDAIEKFQLAGNIYRTIGKEGGYFSFYKKVGDIYMEDLRDFYSATKIYNNLLADSLITDKYKYAILRELSTLKIQEGDYKSADSIVNVLSTIKNIKNGEGLYYLYKAQISIYRGKLNIFWQSIEKSKISTLSPFYKYRLIFEIKALIIEGKIELAKVKNSELLEIIENSSVKNRNNNYSIYLSNLAWINYKTKKFKIAKKLFEQALNFDIKNGSDYDITVSYKNLISFYSFTNNRDGVINSFKNYEKYFKNRTIKGYFDRVIKYHYLLNSDKKDKIFYDLISYIKKSKNPCFWRLIFIQMRENIDRKSDNYYIKNIKNDNWNRYIGLEFKRNYEDFLIEKLHKTDKFKDFLCQHKELEMYFKTGVDISIKSRKIKNNSYIILDYKNNDFVAIKDGKGLSIKLLTSKFIFKKGFNIILDGKYWGKIKTNYFDSLNVYYPLFSRDIIYQNIQKKFIDYYKIISDLNKKDIDLSTGKFIKNSEFKFFINSDDNYYKLEQQLLYTDKNLLWFYGKPIYGYLIYKKLIQSNFDYIKINDISQYYENFGYDIEDFNDIKLIKIK